MSRSTQRATVFVGARAKQCLLLLLAPCWHLTLSAVQLAGAQRGYKNLDGEKMRTSLNPNCVRRAGGKYLVCQIEKENLAEKEMFQLLQCFYYQWGRRSSDQIGAQLGI